MRYNHRDLDKELVKTIQHVFSTRIGLLSDYTLATRHDSLDKFILSLDVAEKDLYSKGLYGTLMLKEWDMGHHLILKSNQNMVGPGSKAAAKRKRSA